ncbi:transcriptional regulator [Pseudomonas sp. WS 5071]|nr:transcriptional regulator [Pseudomonas sp. WS 5071]
MIARKTMTLNLTEAEMAVLEELCVKKDLTKTAVLRQALRLYQAVEGRADNGDKLFFEDDKTKMKSEVVIL